MDERRGLDGAGHRHLVRTPRTATTGARSPRIDAAGRGRPDLGVDAARAQAERAAAPYAAEPPPARGADARLAKILDQLGAAWTDQARAGRPSSPPPTTAAV